LVALFIPSNTKGLSERTAARLKRWALRLIGYNFNIEYINTDDFGQRDALSRLINETRQDAFDEEVEQVIASIQTVDQEIIDITKEALGSSKARRTLRN